MSTQQAGPQIIHGIEILAMTAMSNSSLFAPVSSSSQRHRNESGGGHGHGSVSSSSLLHGNESGGGHG